MQKLPIGAEPDQIEYQINEVKNTNKNWYKPFLLLVVVLITIPVLTALKSALKPKKQIQITYIWIGDKIPSSYVCIFENIDYPHKIIFNPEIVKKFKRELKITQISDLSKLEHIYYHGGLVSDFDNEINYECLMELLDGKEGLYVTAEAEDILSSFYYASEPHNPDMKRVLDSISEENVMQEFAGSPVIKANDIQRININDCVRHKRDWSWRKDEGVDEYSEKWRPDWNSRIKCTVTGKI